jgi:alanine racemase
VRVTIKDIAEKAGVSKTTVSFALNDPSRISEETYRRVMAIVTEMGYVPDPVARTLTTKRLGAIGLLLPQPIHEALSNPYLCELIRGIGEVCEEQGLSLTMLPPLRGRVLDAARRAAVDALITVGVGPGTEVAELLEKRHMPFVTLDGAESSKTVNVGIDDAAASGSLMRHILDLGHRRIAILTLRPEFYTEPDECFSRVCDSRIEGFRQALRAAGIADDDPRISFLPSVGSMEGGAQAAAELFSRPGPRPTALVAMADVAALGAYETCRHLGISIPGDISIAGFDDIPLAAIANPPLTTVRQPGREKGARAAKLALSLLEGGEASHLRLPTELVLRASTAAPRG